MREYVLDVGVRGIRLGVPNDQRRFRVSLDSEARRSHLELRLRARQHAMHAYYTWRGETSSATPFATDLHYNSPMVDHAMGRGMRGERSVVRWRMVGRPCGQFQG